MQLDPLRITADAAYMADFMKSPTRDILNHYLELMYDDHVTHLQNGLRSSVDELRYWQGIIAGLRMAQTIPENVLLWAKQVAGEAGEGKLGKLTLA